VSDVGGRTNPHVSKFGVCPTDRLFFFVMLAEGRASTSFFIQRKTRGWSAFADHDRKKCVTPA
jgi:hypothetical protein